MGASSGLCPPGFRLPQEVPDLLSLADAFFSHLDASSLTVSWAGSGPMVRGRPSGPSVPTSVGSPWGWVSVHTCLPLWQWGLHDAFLALERAGFKGEKDPGAAGVPSA